MAVVPQVQENNSPEPPHSESENAESASLGFQQVSLARPQGMYYPFLPPWHMALLTQQALQAKGVTIPLGIVPGAPSFPVGPLFPPPFHMFARPSLNFPIDHPFPVQFCRPDSPPFPQESPSSAPVQKTPRRPSFTIADLLGTSIEDQVADSEKEKPDAKPTGVQSRFEWLHCTRYKPPKLPRVKRRDSTGQKRKLGRNPRVPFSSSQLAALEGRFRQSQYLSSCDVAEMSSLLNLTETRVKIWFQNRRARERRDKDAKARTVAPTKICPSSGSAFSPVLSHRQGTPESLVPKQDNEL